MTHPRLSLAVLAAAALPLLADNPFTGPRARYQYERERTFDFLHLKLELTPDAPGRSLRGIATHTVAPLGAPRAELRLDAEDLTCDGARVDGAEAKCETLEKEFVIALPREYRPGETLVVAVKYHGRPRKGIYFFGPAQLGPGQPWSVWTQGEDEDNHFWYPGYDYPNDKFTSETLITVPAGWTVISNGKLEGTTANRDGTKTWHWIEKVPHGNYLTSLVAGEYEKFHQSWRGIDVDAYVPRGRLAEAERSFGRTPAMMDYFSELTGQPYPYEKYAQSAVPEFIFGGMENISATTQSDRTLHPAALEEEESSDGLVAHELAHQWFGDFVSFKDWSNAWLSEGFATYFATMWTEHRQGLAEAQWGRSRGAGWYFGSSRKTRRAVVTRRFTDPQDLFDANAYPKGGWILHMLRSRLGDAKFFAGIRAYVAAHRAGLVDSHDFQRAMEAAAGEDLDRFFDSWVFNPGHPELETAWEFDEKSAQVKLTVEQKQKTDDGRLFAFALPVEILYEAGAAPASERRTAAMDAARGEFSFPAAARPVAVLIDPDGTLLASVKNEPGEPALIAQLARAANPVLRAGAADALAEKYPSAKAVAALAAALSGDPFWAVRAAAAGALARGRSPEGIAAVARALPAEKSGRARERMVAALEPLKHDATLAPVLRRLFEGDPSDNVRAAAAGIMIAGDPEGTFDYFKAKLAAPSHHETVRGAILVRWAGEAVRRGLPFAYAYARPGAPRLGRPAAVAALGRYGEALEQADDKRKLREFLVARLDDPQFRVAGAAIDALEQAGDPAAIGALKAAAGRYPDSRQRQDALDAAEALGEKPSAPGEAGKWRAQLKELEAKQEELDKKLKALERKLEEQGKPAPAAPPASPASPASPAASPPAPPAAAK